MLKIAPPTGGWMQLARKTFENCAIRRKTQRKEPSAREREREAAEAVVVDRID